nr:MAG TPA: hypothetical protein [Caudoviricetes sp.]
MHLRGTREIGAIYTFCITFVRTPWRSISLLGNP